MDRERAQAIAARIVAYKLAGNLPAAEDATFDYENPSVGAYALDLCRRYALKQNIRFDGARAEMGRLAQAIEVTQTELHGFMIEYVLPYLIAEGFTATGHIDFEWSGRRIHT
jgi:hypothetical protein